MKTAEEMYYDSDVHLDSRCGSTDLIRLMKDYAEMHVEAALKAAAGQMDADIEWLNKDYEHLEPGEDYEVGMVRATVLNAYPLEKIL